MKRLVLLGVVLLGVVLSAQSAEQQRIEEIRAWLKAIEANLTPDGVTNAKNISTRLGTLSGQFKATTPPPPVPDYVAKTLWDATIPGILARLAKLETAPKPDPDPVPPPPPPPAEICGNGIDDDKDGQVDEGCIVLPPPSSESNAYADALCKLSGAVCYRLQSQAEIDTYRFGRGTYAATVDYDSTAHAAKWQWDANEVSAENIRVPIRLDRPATGTSSLLIISDHRWDAAYLTEYKGGKWKWLQVTSGSSATSARQRIWFQPEMRAIGENAFSSQTPPVLSLFSAREYLGPVAPTVNEGATTCGVSVGGDMLGPMGCFKSYVNRWTRTWIELKVTAGQPYTEISWWLADEQQDAVPMLVNARQISHPPHLEFWFEYNTSIETRAGGPMAAWGRNVIVLKDVADVTPLLQKPVK